VEAFDEDNPKSVDREDENRSTSGGDEDNASSRLHFSEQYSSELLGTAICF
jgi:hypothetical protein